MKTSEDIFPEYYIIRVNEFNDVARTPLEEWIDYLKNGYIRDDTTTPGLSEAREKLLYMMMDKKERRDYEHHLSALAVQDDVLTTARMEAMEEGRAEGVAEIARKMKAIGSDVSFIAQVTGLTAEEITAL